MQLSGLGQIINILSAAVKDLRSFSHIYNAMNNEVPEVGNSQRNLLANAIQRSCTNTQVHIPFNTVSTWLKINDIKVRFVPEQHLKRRSVFIAFFDTAFFHSAIPEKDQERIVTARPPSRLQELLTTN